MDRHTVVPMCPNCGKYAAKYGAHKANADSNSFTEAEGLFHNPIQRSDEMTSSRMLFPFGGFPRRSAHRNFPVSISAKSYSAMSQVSGSSSRIRRTSACSNQSAAMYSAFYGAAAPGQDEFRCASVLTSRSVVEVHYRYQVADALL